MSRLPRQLLALDVGGDGVQLLVDQVLDAGDRADVVGLHWPAGCRRCTDVCVLAAVMDAVDAGYRVILAEDALCSVSDESHDAMLRQFGARFSQQIEVAPVEEILDDWRER
jgi:hypothetical protein